MQTQTSKPQNFGKTSASSVELLGRAIKNWPALPAFSLVELLVVVAIIGFMLSVLIPGLGRARGLTKLIVCRTHLRNVCVSALLYADDNNAALPVDVTLGLENPHTALFAALDGYLQGPENYYCPSETRAELMYSGENFKAGVMGYFYYSCERAPISRDLSTFLRLDVTWPRRLRATMHPQTWVISDSWFSGQPTAHHWFHKGVNYAKLDTSLQMLYTSPRQEFR